MMIINCEVCDGRHNAMREHCPFCGARRVFLASHSYEPQHTRVTYRGESLARELVRAYRTDIAFRVLRDMNF